jgi:hypothetical protein
VAELGLARALGNYFGTCAGPPPHPHCASERRHRPVLYNIWGGGAGFMSAVVVLLLFRIEDNKKGKV